MLLLCSDGFEHLCRHLSEAARLLAKLHAFLLLYGPNIHLCAELAMLLGLLTLPEGLTRIIQPGQAKAPLLWCSEVAAAYTCTVLLEAGLAPNLNYGPCQLSEQISVSTCANFTLVIANLADRRNRWHRIDMKGRSCTEVLMSQQKSQP